MPNLIDLTKERVNPFKGYDPENCIWIPFSEQQKRKTNSRIKSVEELRQLVINFCDASNVDLNTFAKSLTDT